MAQQHHNSAGLSLFNHMDQNDYFVTAPTTPTHFPDIHNHRPDVLDVPLMRIANIQFDIENLNELSSDHNPILLNVYNQSFLQQFKTKMLINWKNFSVKLHESITNPNPSICTATDLDQAAIYIAKLFSSALTVDSTTCICNPRKDLPQAIKIKITKKKRPRRI